jgi:hypothetical protein
MKNNNYNLWPGGNKDRRFAGKSSEKNLGRKGDYSPRVVNSPGVYFQQPKSELELDIDPVKKFLPKNNCKPVAKTRKLIQESVDRLSLANSLGTSGRNLAGFGAYEVQESKSVFLRSLVPGQGVGSGPLKGMAEIGQPGEYKMFKKTLWKIEKDCTRDELVKIRCQMSQRTAMYKRLENFKNRSLK